MLICKALRVHLGLPHGEDRLGAPCWGFAISWTKEMPRPSAGSGRQRLFDLPVISFVQAADVLCVVLSETRAVCGTTKLIS